MSDGVIYYNYGSKCAVRLLVSIVSLKKYYSGPIVIISDGEESHKICSVISDGTECGIVKLNNGDSGVSDGVNYPLIVRTRLNLFSPFEWSVYLDADTLITGDISELFNKSKSFVSTQMCRWKANGKKIATRIKSWSSVCPEYIKSALEFDKAINCGVYAFRRNAPLFNEWYKLTIKNRNSFIPDEVACQILLHKYDHRVVDCRYNYSCKYGPPDITDYRVVHYHGRKHCRLGDKYMAKLWVSAYDDVIINNIADIKKWTPYGDRMLSRYLDGRNFK
jgi:lipopolysaccharide biosynthesis glycosyltransferase